MIKTSDYIRWAMTLVLIFLVVAGVAWAIKLCIVLLLIANEAEATLRRLEK